MPYSGIISLVSPDPLLGTGLFLVPGASLAKKNSKIGNYRLVSNYF